MTKKATEPAWMEPAAFGRSLPDGLGLNLLVRDVEASCAFARHVFQAEIVHEDPDFAYVRLPALGVAPGALGAAWMLHGDHTYSDHRMGGLVRSVQGRGAGAELQLYGLDPDACEARAREWGYQVFEGSIDKPHGRRECYLFDPDWYVWVPSIGIPAGR
jgi:catechol 2,3-dioxygenase-like lactoylglutathione lyase family enzyme